MTPIEKLAGLLAQFPGIGPRQAKRFVYFLLSRQNGFREELARAITGLNEQSVLCTLCSRFFAPLEGNGQKQLCSICINPERDRSLLMVIEKDVDLESVERSHVYPGLYFVLGGRVPILEKNPDERIRSKHLASRIKEGVQTDGLKEIILALSLTTEGENTMQYVAQFLEPMMRKNSIELTFLGRGLSTGTELEYSDTDTLKNALEGRK